MSFFGDQSVPLDPDRIGDVIAAARKRAGLTLRELAARAGTSHTTLSAYERGRKTPGLRVLIRLLNECGLDAELACQPRVVCRNGVPRGEELEQVLALAEQFPADHFRRPPPPVFRY